MINAFASSEWWVSRTKQSNAWEREENRNEWREMKRKGKKSGRDALSCKSTLMKQRSLRHYTVRTWIAYRGIVTRPPSETLFFCIADHGFRVFLYPSTRSVMSEKAPFRWSWFAAYSISSISLLSFPFLFIFFCFLFSHISYFAFQDVLSFPIFLPSFNWDIYEVKPTVTIRWRHSILIKTHDAQIINSYFRASYPSANKDADREAEVSLKMRLTARQFLTCLFIGGLYAKPKPNRKLCNRV